MKKMTVMLLGLMASTMSAMAQPQAGMFPPPPPHMEVNVPPMPGDRPPMPDDRPPMPGRFDRGPRPDDGPRMRINADVRPDYRINRRMAVEARDMGPRRRPHMDDRRDSGASFSVSSKNKDTSVHFTIGLNL